MKSLFNFIVEPIGDRYDNEVKVGDKELIVNTSMENHRYVNRHAVVRSVPKAFKTPIEVGDIKEDQGKISVKLQISTYVLDKNPFYKAIGDDA